MVWNPGPGKWRPGNLAYELQVRPGLKKQGRKLLMSHTQSELSSGVYTYILLAKHKQACTHTQAHTHKSKGIWWQLCI